MEVVRYRRSARMIGRRDRRRGFTLLEAILALAILAAVMVVCLAMRAQALASSARIAASQWAQRGTQELYESLVAGILPDPEIDNDTGVRTWRGEHLGRPFIMTARPATVPNPVAGLFPDREMGERVRLWRYELVYGSDAAADHAARTEFYWRQ